MTKRKQKKKLNGTAILRKHKHFAEGIQFKSKEDIQKKVLWTARSLLSFFWLESVFTSFNGVVVIIFFCLFVMAYLWFDVVVCLRAPQIVIIVKIYVNHE